MNETQWLREGYPDRKTLITRFGVGQRPIPSSPSKKVMISETKLFVAFTAFCIFMIIAAKYVLINEFVAATPYSSNVNCREGGLRTRRNAGKECRIPGINDYHG